MSVYGSRGFVHFHFLGSFQPSRGSARAREEARVISDIIYVLCPRWYNMIINNNTHLINNLQIVSRSGVPFLRSCPSWRCHFFGVRGFVGFSMFVCWSNKPTQTAQFVSWAFCIMNYFYLRLQSGALNQKKSLLDRLAAESRQDKKLLVVRAQKEKKRILVIRFNV